MVDVVAEAMNPYTTGATHGDLNRAIVNVFHDAYFNGRNDRVNEVLQDGYRR